jgi:outer membrane protein TolC
MPQSSQTMKRNWIVGLSTLTLAALTAAAAEAPQTRALSLQDCIQSALEKNLDLQIARYNPPMAQAALQGAYAGYDPNLSASGAHNFSLSGGGFNSSIGAPTPASSSDQNAFRSSLGGLLPWGLNYNLSGNLAESYGFQGGPFDSSSGSASISLTQPLLKNFWIDATRLNIRVAKNRLTYSELGLKQTIMATATSVEQAYYDLIYSRQNVLVQQKAVELAERLVAENKKRLEVGALAPLDLASAEAQAAQSRAAVIAATSQLGTQERVVKQLITDQFSEWADLDLQPSDTLSTNKTFTSRQDSWSKGLTQRPDFLQAKLDIERQGVTLKFNYNQLFPELDLVGSYGHNAGGLGIREFDQAIDQIIDGSRPSYSYGAQITVPLGNTGARAAYRQSKLTLEQLKLTLKKLEQAIMISIDNDIGTLLADFDQVQATRTQREYEDQALDAEQKKLESGKSTTYTVLQVQRDLTTARGAEIQALDTYNKAIAQLSLDEGSTLERLRIDLEVK